MKTNPSIFNHVLGPVAIGPSSSNTAAPFRIGSLLRQLLSQVEKSSYPLKFDIKLAASTSFKRTFLGMKSDLAFINGLLGKPCEVPDFFSAYKNAEDEGIKFSFDTESWQGTGTMKGMNILIADKEGNNIHHIIADSTGGGTVVLLEIDDCSLELRGDCHEILVFFSRKTEKELRNIADTLKKKITTKVELYFTKGSGKVSLLGIKSNLPFQPDFLEELKNITGSGNISCLGPVYPAVYRNNTELPFSSYDEMMKYIEENNYSLWEAAVMYESAVTGWTSSEIFDYADHLWEIINKSIIKGKEGCFEINGIVTPKAGKMLSRFTENSEKPKTVPMGILDIAVPVSLAVMEYSNAAGLIVCIPTGGSAGIVPAVIYSTGEYFCSERKEVVKALLSAGVIGVCMAKDNSFSGGEFGCQAEIGSAAAMASGALVQMMGGTVKQSCDAASLSLQSLLGLVCDPVAGLVQVPCIARNMSATATAVVSANTVVAGFDAVIPFGEMCDALLKVGKIICGCKGIGTTTTPTGMKLAVDQQKREFDARSI